MNYPVKTSGDDWLNKAIELYNKRISLSIIDDTNFGVKKSGDIRQMFKGLNLKQPVLFLMMMYIAIGVICLALLFTLPFNSDSAPIEIFLLSVATTICVVTPGYYLQKYKPPRIITTKDGFDVIFR